MLVYWLRFQIWRSLFWKFTNCIIAVDIVYLGRSFLSFDLLELYHAMRWSFWTSWNISLPYALFRFVYKLQRWRNSQPFGLFALIFFIGIFLRRFIFRIDIFIPKTHEWEVFIIDFVILNDVIPIFGLIFTLVDGFRRISHMNRLVDIFLIAITIIPKTLSHCNVWVNILTGAELTYFICLNSWSLMILIVYRRAMRYILIFFQRLFLSQSIVLILR